MLESGPDSTSVFATSGIPVAVKFLPVRPAADAVKVLPPAVVPTVAVIDAFPSGPVFVDPAETWPAPLPTLQVTPKLGTALPFVSRTRTTSDCASALPTTAVWASPDTTSMVVVGVLFTQYPAALQVG